MNYQIKAIAIAALGVASLAGGLSVSLPSIARADCTPASIDPSCPLGLLSPSNASNPSSPLYIGNAANPASPLNPSNPANPNYQPAPVFNPGGILSGFYSGAGLCQLGDGVCPAPRAAPTAYPTEGYPAARHRHRRQVHVE